MKKLRTILLFAILIAACVLPFGKQSAATFGCVTLISYQYNDKSGCIDETDDTCCTYGDGSIQCITYHQVYYCPVP